jgi:hypothetical protein
MNKNFAVKEGSRVELICPVGGTPQPSISWLNTFSFHTDGNPQWQPQQSGTAVNSNFRNINKCKLLADNRRSSTTSCGNLCLCGFESRRINGHCCSPGRLGPTENCSGIYGNGSNRKADYTELRHRKRRSNNNSKMALRTRLQTTFSNPNV